MTTITLSMEVKDLLDFLKVHKKESYNDVVKRLAERAIDFEPLSEEDIQAIEEGLRDYANGNTYTFEEIEAEIEEEKQKVEECIQ